MRTHLIRIVRIALALALLMTSVAAVVNAAPPILNWGTEVNGAKCSKTGSPVINVSEDVVNSVDSGEGGNNWAFDNYHRTIQFWAQPNGAYCAVVRYAGTFDGQTGQTSPGAGGTLSGAEDGDFEGGYRAIIRGTLKTSPDWPTRGSVGTIDYQCDISGNCPGYIDWIAQYFEPGYTFIGGDLAWWGWVYHGGAFGTWVNSSDGNEGDIVDD